MGTQTGSDVAETAAQETEQSGGVDRRGALRGVAAAGVLGVSGAVLAACSSNSSSNAGSSNGGGSTTTSSSGGGAPTSASSSSASSGSGSTGELTTTAQVPEGSGIILSDAKVVITQPTAGDYKGFSAICTHQGCTVAQISGGLIQCPCHGSEYSIKDGSVVRGPAPSPLPSVTIDVKNGGIFKA